MRLTKVTALVIIVLVVHLIVGVAIAQGAVRINTISGKSYTVPVAGNEILSIEFFDGGQSGSIKIFSNVPNQNSAAFQANRFSDLTVNTSSWDRIPYHMARQFHQVITLGAGQKCFLAGDEAGQKGWSVDNFLYIEIRNKGTVKRLIAGYAEPVYYKGQLVQQIGRQSFSFGPGEIDLTPYIPQGQSVELTVAALDYGGVGYISDLYLIIR